MLSKQFDVMQSPNTKPKQKNTADLMASLNAVAHKGRPRTATPEHSQQSIAHKQASDRLTLFR